VVIDAPLPGIGNCAAQLSNPKTWHFNFHRPDEERLVAGRERLSRPLLERALRRSKEGRRGDAGALHEILRDAARDPRRLRAVRRLPQDGIDNKAFLAKGKLNIPVLAIGAEKSYGAGMATELSFVATNVRGTVVPDSGHWVMEENPDATTKVVVDILTK
jgi:pimeloyl-ACP methyl ester carboxylesterase